MEHDPPAGLRAHRAAPDRQRLALGVELRSLGLELHADSERVGERGRDLVGPVELARKLRPGRPVVKIVASTLQSERYERGHIFQGPVVGPARMSVDSSNAVYEQAGVGPKDLDLVQVHDAFVIEELEYYELLGMCARGEAEACIDRGDFELGGRVPFSTDGGLIARGHPGGPTGLAQIWETTLQLRGEAGKRQVANARNGICHMMGGGSVCVMHILQKG